jgi:hypothetical protein
MGGIPAHFIEITPHSRPIPAFKITVSQMLTNQFGLV